MFKVLINICLLCSFFCIPSHAATVMSAGQDDGYAGRVLDKVINNLVLPAQIKNDSSVKITLKLDGDGAVLASNIIKNSGLKSVDDAVINAVKKAAPFGAPPYGVPTDITLAFWNGMPKPANKNSKQIVSKAARDTAVNADNGKTAVPAASAGTYKLSANGQPVQTPEKYQSYLNNTAWELRKVVYIPKEAAPGTYFVTARIKCEPSGKIISGEIIKSSGNQKVDKYVLQGIKRLGHIGAPPAGLGNSFDLVLRLVR